MVIAQYIQLGREFVEFLQLASTPYASAIQAGLAMTADDSISRRPHAGQATTTPTPRRQSTGLPYGNSSWGGTIMQDPTDRGLFHLFTSQFNHGCGLSGWRPHSFIIRAEDIAAFKAPT
ncbi:hypothetical protein P170DRAFT_479636 [Aspergillus steynii IBT 23096]|uniref:Uncharacterized protein n=1 Tax=Aspergillus steynii IBT 23096 TaxID=1392250 RepID=A0A2I2FWU1_9EURO|nr:uncharacterized protein P170DRAFT_479636 [Aspergillus steynii IBT 23096]PLB45109.1 hypothetical protein P170DRAFT_479636 [Aspergillus steynii IBT 23096]